MTNIYSVAKYILSKKGKMTTMKLQKLCYYCQAWVLVWTEKPIFKEDFRAWPNGPVCIELYNLHKKIFEIDENFLFKNKKINTLKNDDKKMIDIVLKTYAPKDGYFLMQLSHTEKPWIDARGTKLPGEDCNKIIEKSAMQKYYGGICA